MSMFARAVQVAQAFTRPLIVSKRLANGTVTSGCAAFVIVNDDGWMVTAGHVTSELVAHQQQSGAGDAAGIANLQGLVGQDRNAAEQVLKSFLCAETDGQTADTKPGKRRSDVDAEAAENDQRDGDKK